MHFPRIEALRTDHDKTQIASVHLNREVCRRDKKGEREIPVWAVIQLAERYRTSADYLLGLTDQR